MDCVYNMNEIDKKEKCIKDFLIIIIYMDYYIFIGKMIEDVLDGLFFGMFENKYGELFINKNRIYYMIIDEFEFMIEVCCNKNVLIMLIIDSCFDNDVVMSF